MSASSPSLLSFPAQSNNTTLSDLASRSEKPPLYTKDPAKLDLVISQIRARLYIKNLEMQPEENRRRTYIINHSAHMERSDLQELLSDIKTEDWTVKVNHKRSLPSGDLRLHFKYRDPSMAISRTPALNPDVVRSTSRLNSPFYVTRPDGRCIALFAPHPTAGQHFQ